MRDGEIDADEGSAAHVIARYRDLGGGLLDKEVAAVELINVLRPVVAVGRYVIFAALALREHPECLRKLRSGDDGCLELFVQEVRRFYPFFPFIGDRVGEEFDWRGRRFAEGTWVLLDLYGTNHDPRIWDESDEFRPERFRDWDGSAFDFIPQGGDGHYDGHRCAGEWITIELTKRATRLLATAVHYEVPEQNLDIDLSRMPAILGSRFVIRDVQRVRC